MPTIPRGFRNNNPGNVRHGKSRWQGMAHEPDDHSMDSAFITMVDMPHGVRLIREILRGYYRRRNLTSIRAMIDTYAPPNENNTEAYIKRVAGRLGIGANDRVDIDDPDTLRALVEAIILVECGSNGPHEDGLWVSPEDITAGLALP